MINDPNLFPEKTKKTSKRMSFYLVGEAGLDCMFASGKHQSVDVVEPTSSRCPPDICIEMGSSLFYVQVK